MKNIAKFFGVSIVVILLISGMGGASAVYSDLLAGQHTPVGDVHVRRIGEILQVTFTTDGKWTIVETHLAVAKSLAEIPQTKSGNPKIGHFHRFSGFPAEITPTEVIYRYNLNGQRGVFYFAAHAEVSHPDLGKETETAWANTGQSFDGSSWALYFTVNLGPEP